MVLRTSLFAKTVCACDDVGRDGTDVRSGDIPGIESTMERCPVTLLILSIGVDGRMSKQEPHELEGGRVTRRARSMQHAASERVPRVDVYYRCIPRGCRGVAGERRVPLRRRAAASAGRAQLVRLACGLGVGLSRPLALLKSPLEFSLLAEGKVRMKHAHIRQVRSEARRCALLTRMQRIYSV